MEGKAEQSELLDGSGDMSRSDRLPRERGTDTERAGAFRDLELAQALMHKTRSRQTLVGESSSRPILAGKLESWKEHCDCDSTGNSARPGCASERRWLKGEQAVCHSAHGTTPLKLAFKQHQNSSCHNSPTCYNP